jgi:hypothetical protein
VPLPVAIACDPPLGIGGGNRLAGGVHGDRVFEPQRVERTEVGVTGSGVRRDGRCEDAPGRRDVDTPSAGREVAGFTPVCEAELADAVACDPDRRDALSGREGGDRHPTAVVVDPFLVHLAHTSTCVAGRRKPAVSRVRLRGPPTDSRLPGLALPKQFSVATRRYA